MRGVGRGLLLGKVVLGRRVQAFKKLVREPLAQLVVQRIKHRGQRLGGGVGAQGLGLGLALCHNAGHGLAVLNAGEIRPVQLRGQTVQGLRSLLHGGQLLSVAGKQRSCWPWADGDPCRFLTAGSRGAAA